MPIGLLDQLAADQLAKSLGAQDAPWGQPYTPSQAAFKCTPTYPVVQPATFMPQPTRLGDLAAAAALKAYGLSTTQIGQHRAQAVKYLAPFAGLFGLSAFIELLHRLHYSAGKLLTPPEDLDSTASQASLGQAPGPAKLAARLLLCVPGHFRELARRAADEAQAHTVESMGWVLAEWLRDQIAAQTRYSFWIPTSPPFVNASRHILIAEMASLPLAFKVAEHTLFDKPGYEKSYQQAFTQWRDGPAGKAWRLETGMDKASSGAGPGLPFYPEVVAARIPPHVNIASAQQKARSVWASAVQWAMINKPGVPDRIKWLTNPDNKGSYLAKTGLTFKPVPLGGLEMTYSYPILTSHKRDLLAGATVRVLSSLVPAFSGVFATIHDLGWNDLMFQKQGTLAFRGEKSGGTVTQQKKLARALILSNHGWGAAIDVNHFENPIGNPVSRIDPRIVALWEGFGFKYLGCENYPDPHHFQYR
jgi:hypothetical protein